MCAYICPTRSFGRSAGDSSARAHAAIGHHLRLPCSDITATAYTLG